MDPASDMSKIMDEFHCLYNERLKQLDKTANGNLEVKIDALEEWIRDLTEQNRMLIKTVEHLEKNAIDRVDKLDAVMQARTLEEQNPPCCKECPILNERLQSTVKEVDCQKRIVLDRDCLIKKCNAQIEELQRCINEQAFTTQSSKKHSKNNVAELEFTICELKTELNRNEKLLKSNAEEMSCLKQCLTEKEQQNHILKLEADKTRCIPQLKEAVEVLRDAVKQKDTVLEQYSQEVNCLKEELNSMEDQNYKILQLEDTLKYCQQSLKQKDLMLDKLKEHIKQLRNCLAQLQCQQERTKINRSLSTEETYNPADTSGYTAYFNDGNDVFGGGDSELIDELKKKLANEKDMQVALTAEVAEKHDAIMRLKEHVKELEEQLRQSDMQTHFKDDIIRQLRKEVKLGRAKESLAEMLGLKGGPRAQMKAKIDNLNSELEEREIEISRLEGKLEASRLPTVEAKLTRLEVELVDRERSILALCDKLDYVRKYLSKLRGSEEDISVKCGLEALLLELSEDVEWTREARRNVSIPLTDDLKESIIIINHRSHSLPDTTLQKQLQAFNASAATPESSSFSDNDGQNFKEISESITMKEQLIILEKQLSETLLHLSQIWETMRNCEVECGDSMSKLTQQVQDAIENEHSQLLQVNNEFQCIQENIDALSSMTSDNDYLVHCIEKCLIDSLELLKNQKSLMGLDESSTGLLTNENDKLATNLRDIIVTESNLNDSVSLLQQLKIKLPSWNQNTRKLGACKLKDLNNIVNDLISNKQNVLDKLYLIHLSQDEISKKIFKKCADFNRVFESLQNIVKNLKTILNHYIFNDFFSKNTKVEEGAPCNAVKEQKDAGWSFRKIKQKQMESEGNNEIEAKRIKTLRRNRLSRSSPSIGEEYHSDNIGDIHMKSAHLHQIALALNEEVKSYLKEVLIREDKVRRFISESQELNKSLDTLSKELIISEKFLTENNMATPLQSLLTVLGQTRSEVELLLCKTDDFTNYKEMYDMNRSKMEQEIHALQKEMFTVVSEIMDAIKASQERDTNLLNSYRTKIQTYREKVEQLEKHLTNDQNVSEEREEEDDLIFRLTEKLEKYQNELVRLKNSMITMKKDKENTEIENQRAMEELQIKICNLQATLQNESQQRQPPVSNNKPWFFSWPPNKQIYSRHIHDV